MNGVIGSELLIDGNRSVAAGWTEDRVVALLVEFYDGVGNLLQASWFDQFGIRRTAIDRGLLQEEGSRLEGVLTLISEGISV